MDVVVVGLLLVSLLLLLLAGGLLGFTRARHGRGRLEDDEVIHRRLTDHVGRREPLGTESPIDSVKSSPSGEPPPMGNFSDQTLNPEPGAVRANRDRGDAAEQAEVAHRATPDAPEADAEQADAADCRAT
jgi:hypothetical protein